jgi:hypothetical protein
MVELLHQVQAWLRHGPSLQLSQPGRDLVEMGKDGELKAS